MNKVMLMTMMLAATACSKRARPEVLDVKPQHPMVRTAVPGVDPIVRVREESTVYVVQGGQIRAMVRTQPGDFTVPLRQVTQKTKGPFVIGVIPGPIDGNSFELLNKCMICVPQPPLPCCP